MKQRLTAVALEALLLVRGIVYRGRGHSCPICGAEVRSFVHGGGSFRRRPRGYCPRCNAKARHRRVWLHCLAETDWAVRPTRLLHVGPKYCLSRHLSRMPSIAYDAVDVVPRPHVTIVGSITDLPRPEASFDGVLSIHVLEHLDDDRAAMAEMYRVLTPGGIAVINVPTDMDADTYEDPSITSEADRRRAFGEADHRRVYGSDLVDRLSEAGFEVTVHRADTLAPALLESHGLTLDEHVFHCRKPEIVP